MEFSKHSKFRRNDYKNKSLPKRVTFENVNRKRSKKLLNQEESDILIGLIEKFDTLKSKNILKVDKSAIIDSILHKVNKTDQKKFLIKEKFLAVLQFANKYGSEEQRDAILEIFINNIVIMLASPIIKKLIKSLFLYGNKKRRMLLVEALGHRLPKMFYSKGLSSILNRVFVKHFDILLKNETIKYFFGNSYLLFKTSYPQKNIFDFISDDSLLDSSFSDIFGLISNFINKQVYSYDFFHYFLNLLITYNPLYFKKHIIPILSLDIFPSFISTNYGCGYLTKHIILISFNTDHNQTVKYVENEKMISNPTVQKEIIGDNNSLSDSLSENSGDVFNLSKVLNVISPNFVTCLQFSIGIPLIWTIICIESIVQDPLSSDIQSFLTRNAWDHLINNMSFQISQNIYWLKFLEILPLKFDIIKEKKHFHSFLPLIKFIEKIGIAHIYIKCDPINCQTFQFHKKFVLNKIEDHFVKNYQHILSDANYGFFFCEWLQFLSDASLLKIFEGLINLLNVKIEKTSNDNICWWKIKNSFKILKKIMENQLELKNNGMLQPNILADLILTQVKKKYIKTWNSQFSNGKKLFELLSNYYPDSKKFKID